MFSFIAIMVVTVPYLPFAYAARRTVSGIPSFISLLRSMKLVSKIMKICKPGRLDRRQALLPEMMD